jgi:hypothetical protein
MMGNRRRVAGIVIASACLLAAGVLGPGGVARATTGPSTHLQPTYKVNNKFGQQFVGQYILKSVPAAAHLQSAALGIEVGSNGFLYGIGQFYGYDASGSQSSWVATLYHFHQTSKAQMTIDLLVPATEKDLIGRLFVAPPLHNILSGKIEIGRHTYPVSFRHISTR